MSATATIYPYRQALSLALKRIIMGAAVPGINASLTAQYTAQAVASGVQVQFSASDVRIGDIVNPLTPCICITGGRFQYGHASNTNWWLTLWTTITLKMPTAADNTPEDFEMLEQVVTDAVADALTCGAAYNIDPTNPATGSSPLPAGSKFNDCYLTGGSPLPNSKNANGVDICRRFSYTHVATISSGLNRPGALAL